MKLTKAKAQSQITRSALGMSARLYDFEQECAAKMAVEFALRIPVVEHKTVAGVRNNHDLREAWVDAHTLAISSALAHVQVLADTAAELGESSIRAELLLCERALPARFAGLTDRLVVRTDRLVAAAVEGWQGGMSGQRAEYRLAQTDQLSRTKTIEELTERLFGRPGVWWQALGVAEGWARWCSVTVSNKVRIAGMKAFNDA